MMIPNQPEFEQKNCVVVPLAFFDKIMRCYYGTGPRDGDPIYQLEPENKSTEIIPDISKLQDVTMNTTSPEGYEPRGIAAKKLEAKSGIRQRKTTKEQSGSSKSN